MVQSLRSETPSLRQSLGTSLSRFVSSVTFQACHSKAYVHHSSEFLFGATGKQEFNPHFFLPDRLPASWTAVCAILYRLLSDKRFCAQVISQGILIIQPVRLYPGSHHPPWISAKNFSMKQGVSGNQFISECKMLLEVVSRLGKPVYIPCLPSSVLTGRKFRQGWRFSEEVSWLGDQHAHRGDRGRRQKTEYCIIILPFFILSCPPRNRK